MQNTGFTGYRMSTVEKIPLTPKGILPTQPFFLIITTSDDEDGKAMYYLGELE